MTPGKVSIVGAGPGDPGLVTCRAKELIASADVVVHDGSVPPAILAWCRADCEKICAGGGAERAAWPQEEMESLVVARAEAGRRVVLLKNGDPYVFGPGGDEVRRLAARGIPFEVVPGVTAALAAAACAGIPLTGRDGESPVVFLNGGESPATSGHATDWRRYGAIPGATLAVYLGMDHLRLVLAGLVAGGLSPASPAAVVQWASLGRQRSVAGTAGTLADLAESEHPDAPAVLLVGEGVRDRGETDWFERLPLFGRRIAVTRAQEQAGDLRRKLELLGADVIELPLIEIRPKADRETTLEVFAELGHYDWLVFTSANGVRHFFDLFLKGFRDLRALGVMRIACVGEATARLVRALHLEVEICPAGGTAEALAEAMIATGSLDHGKVLVVTGNHNRDLLVRKLDAARAIVDTFPVYENVRVDLKGNPDAEDFQRSGADAVLFASSSAVEAFSAQAGGLQPAAGARSPLAGSIGPVTSAALRSAGLRVDFEAQEPTLDALVNALVAKLPGH